MTLRLPNHVLTLDPAKLHEVDTANTQSLHGMWTVFSKCADYMEQGRRLENLSWRLWTRETFCVDPAGTGDTSVLPLLRAETTEVPPLSASVDSASSEADRIESHIKRTRSSNQTPTIVYDESSLALLPGKEKHITPLGLERMVLSIKRNKKLERLSSTMNSTSPPATDTTPQPTSPFPTNTSFRRLPPPHHSAESCSTTALEGNDSDTVTSDGSNTSVSSSGVLSPKPTASITKSPSIVRGFSPSQVSASYRSNPRLSTESCASAKTTNQRPSIMKKTGGMFTLGGSSGDDESSFEDRMTSTATQPHRSSLSEELSKPETRAQPTPPVTKKVASFSNHPVEPIQERVPDEDEDAIETDDEDAISESAIEDEDESEWEDSVESGHCSPDDKELFQRVDSRPNLVSRRSLLTMMIHQPAKMNAVRSTPALQRSRLASPNGPSDPNSVEEEEDSNLTMRGPDVPRSKPIIVKPNNVYASGAHSPRTTRRNMLASELTESLRRHLLWERQQKSATANAVFRRRHTAHDMANLQDYPGPNGVVRGTRPGVTTQPKDKDCSKNGSWNNFYDYGPWEYHAKGW